MNIIIAATLFLMKFSQWDQEFYEVALEIKNLRLWNETFAKMDHLDNRLKAIYVEQAKDFWIYGQNTQIAKYIVRGTQKPL